MSDIYTLPPVKSECGQVELLHFPTRMQTFVFRNWELVPAESIANVLGVSKDIVCALANDMGLPPQQDVSVWLQRGYITIIKQNWQLIPYEQLLQLLGWDEATLAYILREDDFLSTKLGGFKFDCAPVVYEQLTEKQQEETAEIVKIVKSLWTSPSRAAFDFFGESERVTARESSEKGVYLTNEWGIQDCSGFERSGIFTSHFIETVQKEWNIQLNGKSHRIVLKSEAINDKAGKLYSKSGHIEE